LRDRVLYPWKVVPAQFGAPAWHSLVDPISQCYNAARKSTTWSMVDESRWLSSSPVIGSS
jgi:hypothetical protein